ncbi:MAG: sulfur carrier protein ThiS adenylyltransferase ThiF [Anaerohalosphaeraceae bacterium]
MAKMPCPFFELKNAVVGIAGLGGLGSNVAVALTRLRVGKLILADFDGVEESNLNRQNYFHDQVGRHKVDASMENLRRIDPDANLVGNKVRLNPDNIPQVFAGAHIIAECFDRADQKQMIVETVLSKMKKTIIVTVSGLAGFGRSNEISTTRLSPRLVFVGDGVSRTGPGIPLTAGRVGVAAYHQANAITEILLNELNFMLLRGGTWTND